MIVSQPSPEDRQFLELADIILLAGGSVEKGWHVFEENGLWPRQARTRPPMAFASTGRPTSDDCAQCKGHALTCSPESNGGPDRSFGGPTLITTFGPHPEAC